MIDFKTIADNADLIINGYAFTKSGDYNNSGIVWRCT